MLGAAIRAGISAIGGIFGGMSASKAMRNVKNNLNQQRAENRNWFDRRYNEDATQRADAVAAVTQMQEAIRQRNKAAEGAQAVAGATEEAAAATKEANAQAHADAVSHIASDAANRKDSIESQYLSKDEALQSELNDLERTKAQQVSQATDKVTQTAANISQLF